MTTAAGQQRWSPVRGELVDSSKLIHITQQVPSDEIGTLAILELCMWGQLPLLQLNGFQVLGSVLTPPMQAP